jgi:hypothetical protein
LKEWSPGAITAAPSYANATSGALYRGARATPRPSFSTFTLAAAPTREHAVPIVRSTELPLSMGAGIFLFVAGGAISVYNWLRSQRVLVSAQATSEVEQDDLLDADLVDVDPER